MANLQGFDANEVEPANDLEPIPVGKYVAVITDSEMKPTKSGAGSYLQLTFQIIEGEHSGRLLWVRLNLDNPNATAVEIARRELVIDLPRGRCARPDRLHRPAQLAMHDSRSRQAP